MATPLRAGVLLVLLAGPTAAAAPATGRLASHPFRDLAGATVRLDRLSASVVVVDLWATWCPPCVRALPHLDALARDGAERGLAVLAISQDADATVVAPFVRKLGTKHLRVLLDPDHVAGKALSPPAMPTTYVIDARGRIAATFPGYENGDEVRLRATVQRLLDQAGTRHVARERRLMGTRFSVRAFVRGAAQAQAVDASLDRVAGLQARWSPWAEGSDVARINAGAGKPGRVRVPADTLGLLQRSLHLCRLTGRAFDPSFVPLGRLYDLRARPFVPPDLAQVEVVRPLVDCRQVEVDARRRQVRLAREGMALHFGANAKGAALDAAAEVLRKAGIDRFVVDGGGDVVAAGEGPKGAWRVGVQHPRAAYGKLIGVVRVTGGAVATSGDYERFAIVRGRRWHHILDPRTGEPATGCASATVVVPPGPRAGETADSWATILCVLGPQEGFPLLADVPGLQAAVVTPEGVVRATHGFPTRLDLGTPPGGFPRP